MTDSPERQFGPGDRVAVLLPLPLDGAYDYRVPEGMVLGAGDLVEVPLGGRRVAGVVWGAGAGGVGEGRLKAVARRLDPPPLSAALRRFVDWVAGYTLTRPGAVLRMVLSVPEALEPPRPLSACAPADGDPRPDLRMTPARRRVLDLLADGPPRPTVDLAREAAVGPEVVRGLIRAGALVQVDLSPPAAFDPPDGHRPGPALSEAQELAAGALRGALAAGYSATLLDGVPGSGKTEVYFEAVAQVLRQGGQALVLLPEIALSAQWLNRFAERFGAVPAQWHSDLGQAARRTTWRAVADGSVKVVVGARSALFLPFASLGLIVVDEEHDASFKQEDGVIYNARDMAVVRAVQERIPIVLASGTPSLESVVNAAEGRYARLHLPERHAGAALPEVGAVDLRRAPPPSGDWLSPDLRRAVGATLERGEQAMLFLNRRGYAPLTLCRACGHRMQCPNCTAWLVEHRLTGRLQCHHCGFSSRLPEACPNCGAAGGLIACGPGVERVAEEAARLWPGARIAIAASDTLTGPLAAADLVARQERHEIDLLVGTQVIAKGYHFPLLTLVGVVDADIGLSGGDLRAAERTFQLLYQVAGRAGRAERPGRVLLQTAEPDHPVIRALAAADRDRFLEVEAEARRAAAMPPFGRLVALIVSGRDEAEVDALAGELARRAPRGPGIAVLGPAPAPLALLRGRHRRRLLLKAERSTAVQPLIRRWLSGIGVHRTNRIQIDVDPYSFM